MFIYFQEYVRYVSRLALEIRTKTKICFYLCVSKYAFSQPELV